MSTYKPGDWLIDIKGSQRPLNTIFKVEDEYTRYRVADVRPWQPEPGEWCWFWDISWQYPQLLQFDGIDDNIFKSKTTIEIGDVDCYRWSHCEPFIGQLPSICKE